MSKISVEEVLAKYSSALRSLRSKLTELTPAYSDVRPSQLAQQIDWEIDDVSGNLVGKSWLFGMLSGNDGIPDDETLAWDGKNWVSPLEEVHIDDPSEAPQFGGAEPVPVDLSGKDQKEPNTITMESIRQIVREYLNFFLSEKSR